MEHFYTIQGEGFHTGTAAYFIRLAGCDVGCVWCDVKDSWYTEGYPVLTIEEIIAEVKKHPVKTIVITGGEPWMYNLNNLTSTLIKQGYKTHIETSGAHPPSGNWDWITLSPKKFKEPLPEALQRADELKVIVYNKTDFKWGEQYAEKVLEKCKLFLQPEWSKQEAMVPLIIDYAKQKPQWRISLQTHKFMDIP
ncbi:UNVERIFIED_CONTAM: hypothetical protein GTU68_019784 [Idotea baltica]|nr:hypothetical protein [Idotea baltica]